VPDHDVLRALHTLEPLLSALQDRLISVGVPADVLEDAVAAVGEAYAIGHVDGVRHAVAQIAPVAEKAGLRLGLAPDVQAAGPPG
jgi:hypothetical protein